METYSSKILKIKNKKRLITTYAMTEKGLIQKQFDAEVKDILTDCYRPSMHSFAYQSGKNVLNNAQIHIKNTEFVIMDIKDFFPSLNHKILERELIYQIKLNKTEQLINPDLTRPLLSKILGKSKCGIHQGLICSPILSDIYLTSFDALLVDSLQELEKSTHSPKKNEYRIFNTKYSRYADDITISFSPDYKENIDITIKYKKEIVEIVKGLLKDYKLKINDKKTHFISSYNSSSVKITGLNLNFGTKKIRVSKKYINDLFWDSVKQYESLRNLNGKENIDDALKNLEKLIGKEAFVFSIDPNYFNIEYSEKMREIVHKHNFTDLKDMLKFTNKKVIKAQEKLGEKRNV